MDKFVNLLFDLDGTIADTSEDIIDCAKRAYLDILNEELIITKTNLGPSISEIIAFLKPDIDDVYLKKIIIEFRNYYDNNFYKKTKLYDGMFELLTYLKISGYKLFIVTNKPNLPTGKILKKIKIYDLFIKIVTPDLKNNINLDKAAMIHYLVTFLNLDKKKTIMIGDTSNDISAAKENDIQSLMVLYGYGNYELIKNFKPDYLVKKVNDFYNIL